MVIKKSDGRFYKNCSSCGAEQSYLRKSYAIASESAGKVCKKCANNKLENNGHAGFYKEVLRASFAHKYKTSAEIRNIEWDVSFEYLADLLIEQDFKCALSGEDLDAMEVSNNCSLDRIDSSKGYVKGNLQWVTSMVNMCKQGYTQEEFIKMCKQIADKVKW